MIKETCTCVFHQLYLKSSKFKQSFCLNGLFEFCLNAKIVLCMKASALCCYSTSRAETTRSSCSACTLTSQWMSIRRQISGLKRTKSSTMSALEQAETYDIDVITLIGSKCAAIMQIVCLVYEHEHGLIVYISTDWIIVWRESAASWSAALQTSAFQHS